MEPLAAVSKSYALLLECLRHVHNNRFGAIVFRRNANQIFTEGSLWDTATQLYMPIGARARRTPKPQFVFPSGAKITFAHIERDEEVHGYQGSQIPLICFDELTHFSKYQFFYMLSRNRSLCGVDPYVRATCNPDKDSFVAELIAWWLDPETGYPIEERAGVLRYFIRRDDAIHWAGSKEELWEAFDLHTPEEREEPRSFTFIPSRLTDNEILMKENPQYLSNLKALPLVERERLLFGNWKIMPAAGMYFKRADALMIDAVPDDVHTWVRAWDMAATEDRKLSPVSDGPAFTAGVLIGKRKNGRYVIADVINQRLSADMVRQTIHNTARADKAKYKRVKVRLSQDPGQAGKDQAEQYVKLLAGFPLSVVRESGDKVTRAEPFSAQWQRGNVDILLADWNGAYFSQMESFPEGKFKDMVDATANGFSEIVTAAQGIGLTPGLAEGTRESPWMIKR